MNTKTTIVLSVGNLTCYKLKISLLINKKKNGYLFVLSSCTRVHHTVERLTIQMASINVEHFQVVSNLVRCCDVSEVTQSSIEGEDPAPNPYLDPALQTGYLTPIQPLVSEYLFQRYGHFCFLKNLFANCKILYI